MEQIRLLDYLSKDSAAKQIREILHSEQPQRIFIEGLCGSRDSFLISASALQSNQTTLVIATDKEDAAYMFGDLEQLTSKKNLFFFPDSFKRPLFFEELDPFQVQQRIECVDRFNSHDPLIIVSYPEALFEKVVSNKDIKSASLHFSSGNSIDLDQVIDTLIRYGFVRVDFVYEPGQFSLRGGIIDLFSLAAEHPYRIELNDDVIESIRTFDTISQLSIKNIGKFTLIPNLNSEYTHQEKKSLIDLLPKQSSIWTKDLFSVLDSLQKCTDAAIHFGEKMEHYAEDEQVQLIKERAFIYPDDLMSSILDYHLLFFGTKPNLKETIQSIQIQSKAQPSFNKNFNLLIQDIKQLEENGFICFLLSNSSSQIERFHNIFDDLKADIHYISEIKSLREGFIDEKLKLACYTDHQIFSRYHGYKIKQGFSKDQAASLSMLRELQSGDYVTHLDHGIGKFAGLEKITVNGHQQEVVRLIYKNSDILYVSVHSLHKISKYVGQEGTEPTLHKLGSDTWKILKAKTKQKVKDIAKELIKLYASRKASKGHAFAPDNYMQAELEASFIYEDTPDQYKATVDVKLDMEKDYPMDRLICGDVGFGKTEVAIRAAFKAVQDGKQVAVLVPTTILALQHFRTFKERFKEFPVDVDYVSRFRSQKEKTSILKQLKEGKLDLIIGTHSLLNKNTEFKDLGLLIIDEEQKFGVAAKEKLRHFKVNVDTLTLTATPIPRTLQFSLMAARDLSVINTPPPNRQPIHTERKVINDELIRESIMNEVYRGGQVFFVHNRVKSLGEVAEMLKKLCPDVDIAIAHGQLEADKLEEILVDFIDHKYDVLVCTNIIETGLDIPNANTILINNAHHFGLSDLHQLRGRVGRSNRKAYCYLFAPPSSVLTLEARKRLKTIEEFSELGSGLNVAMRDLDIRGAGNLLGGEQSGFIADIGYETYQKILEEAIDELKENEFKEEFKEEKKEQSYVRDVNIDTDVEMHLPDQYVSNNQERLILYQRLDKIKSEEEIVKYQKDLQDRFGPIPPPTNELFQGLRLRWIAKTMNFERVVLKKKKLQCFFISNPSSSFFESGYFHSLLNQIGTNKSFQLKQSNQLLILIKEDVKNLQSAIQLLQELHLKISPNSIG
ncbi:MAG TPA: transcription-repair coupling factor [Saprospiraceae bacterium]|nr:transcription-repair coupling factor [Saprospiraceae bacterium]